MKLVILGGPGAGKGTLANILCSRLDIPFLDMGQTLREAIASNSPLGQKAKPYVDQGELVPDEIMIQFVRHRLLAVDPSKGWLLDGYPRTAFQAEELDFLLEDLGQNLRWAIYLNVSDTLLMARSLQRSRDDDTPQIIQNYTQSAYPSFVTLRIKQVVNQLIYAEE